MIKDEKILYEEDFYLRAADVDIGNRWKPSAIFISTQELGETHSRILGFSRQDLGKKDAFFVLMRQRYDLQTYPVSAQKIHAQTWLGNTNRKIFPRFYRFSDEYGTEIGHASSIWMLCSLSDRKILSPAEYGIDLPQPNILPLPTPEKLRFIQQPQSTHSHLVSYSDMDYNGHANNTQYINWICDLFSIEKFKQTSLKKFQINYINELRGGEKIILDLYKNQNDFEVQGTNEKNNNVIFHAAGSWF